MLHVDPTERAAKQRAHTATHLLHYALNQLIDTKQAGSLVDGDYLRFDFTAKDHLSENDLRTIEQTINDMIYEGLDVKITEMSYQDAINQGAKAFFEDKYGDTVRLVNIANKSLELCGGTHVSNTAFIGGCKIIEYKSIASGVKRIEAVVGKKLLEYGHSQDAYLQSIAQRLQTTPKQLPEKLDKMEKHVRDLEEKYQKIYENWVMLYIMRYHEFGPIDDFTIMLKFNPMLGNFAEFCQAAYDITCYNTFLYCEDGTYAFIGPGAKQTAQTYGLKGGGKDDFWKGKDLTVLTLIATKKEEYNYITAKAYQEYKSNPNLYGPESGYAGPIPSQFEQWLKQDIEEEKIMRKRERNREYMREKRGKQNPDMDGDDDDYDDDDE